MNRSWLVALLFAAACSGKTSGKSTPSTAGGTTGGTTGSTTGNTTLDGPALASSTPIDPGTECPNGGVRIAVGADADRNGQLSTDETSSSSVVCNGADASSITALANQTALPRGDTTCPTGGVLVSYGLDNGDGDGTAANGTLETDEIDGSQAVCNGADALGLQPFNPPPALPSQPQFHVKSNGSHNPAGDAGRGGHVSIKIDPGSKFGHVKVFNTGVAQADFVVPPHQASLGAAPYDIAPPGAPTVVTIGYKDLATAADNEVYYSTLNDNQLTRRIDAATSVAITGMRIPPEVTLELPAEATELHFVDDVVVAGTIAPHLDASGNRSSLTIEAAVVIVPPAPPARASFDMTGGVFDPGGDGGVLKLVSTVGAMFMLGKIYTTGAPGSTLSAGDGGKVTLTAHRAMYVTGEILARGGDTVAPAAPGGPGGDVSVVSEHDSVFFSGEVDTSSGNGANVSKPGNVLFRSAQSANDGDVTISGTAAITASDTCTGCTASSGATITIQAAGGDIRAAAPIQAQRTTTAASTGLLIQTVPGANRAGGSIFLSGDLSTEGIGSKGARGGDITISIDTSDQSNRQEIVMLGYQDINTHGGDGSAKGGVGGDIQLYQENSNGGGVDGASGGVVNYAHLDSSGGQGGTDTGGAAGVITLRSAFRQSFDLPSEQVINRGNLLAISGGGIKGGLGGNIYLWGFDGVDNGAPAGPVTVVNADAGTSMGDAGVDGASIRLLADNGPVINRATLSAKAGSSATAAGGNANLIEVVGRSVHNFATGAMQCVGGDSSGLVGGAGGTVYLTSNFGATQNDAALSGFSVDGGAGSAAGPIGYFILAGANATSQIP